MDYFRELESIRRQPSVNEKHEILKVMSKEETRKLPYKNTCKKGTGEYYASIDDKIKLLYYLKDHPTIPIFDRRYVKETLMFIDEYERKGMFYGVSNGFVALFLPGIRTLAFYKRIPIASLFVLYWCNWGHNYGRDLVLVKSRNFIENWERDNGLRQFQLST